MNGNRPQPAVRPRVNGIGAGDNPGRFEACTLADIAAAGFDDIIDVRSPAEYAEDHVPGAVNLPALDDAERARVGTIYVQDSAFIARRIGASLVARNAARYLEGYLADKGPRYRPLVYCWRGGQRSGSLATILAQIGWRVAVLDGGWRSYRRMVKARLYDMPLPSSVVLLDGNTGSAKTALLAQAVAQGAQVIDLEGLARHRGSLFGAMPGGQPSQKRFESLLAARIEALNPARPVLIEAESNKVGDLIVPPSLWRAMCGAPRIEILAPVAARAAHLVDAYAELGADRAALAAVIDRLRPFHPAERVEAWQRMAAGGALHDLAAGLMADHYDPRYARTKGRQAPPAAVLEAAHLDQASLGGLAGEIRRLAGLLAQGRSSFAD